MKKFVIQGGKPLKGEVKVSGSKNATLPIICASLLTKEKVRLENVPDIADVRSLIKIIEELGVGTSFKNNVLEINSAGLKNKKIPDNLVIKMRASILVLGALLPRLKEVNMAFPGGCVLGKRSVHAHTHALKELGCKVIDDKRGLHLKVKKLKGKKIILPELSVTATENAVMVGALSEGITEIHLAATEPHVQDLCNFLKKMGANISGIGTNNLKIKGVKTLKGGSHKIIGDYLEAGTFAIAAAATGGDVVIKGINPDDLNSLWQKFEEMGIKISISNNSVHIFPSKKLNAVSIKTAVHPGFPTDLQAPFALLLAQAHGVSKVFETLFEGRLNYLVELERMGVRVELLNPHQALIIGPNELRAIPIASGDIRAGAAMVIAALATKGETEISNIDYIDRGYEKIDEKLKKLGANIQRK